MLTTVLFLTLIAPSLAQQAGAGGPGGGSQPAIYDQVKTAHAALGILAWVVFFPLGGVVIRLLSRPRSWLIHGLWQLFSYAMFTAAVGMGIWMTNNSKNSIGSYHPVIGLLVFSLVSLEPVGGYIHHILYKRRGTRNEAVAQTHIWLGRVLITLGMINGGLGLLLSSDGNKAEYIAYGVITACLWLTYVAYIAVWEIRTPSKKRGIVEKQIES